MKLVDTAGRIDKFNQRYGKYKKGAAAQAAPEASAPEVATPDVEENSEGSAEG